MSTKTKTLSRFYFIAWFMKQWNFFFLQRIISISDRWPGRKVRDLFAGFTFCMLLKRRFCYVYLQDEILDMYFLTTAVAIVKTSRRKGAKGALMTIANRWPDLNAVAQIPMSSAKFMRLFYTVDCSRRHAEKWISDLYKRWTEIINEMHIFLTDFRSNC